VTDEPNPAVQTVGTEDLRDGAYVGGFAGPRSRVADLAYLPAPVRAQPAVRRSVPKNVSALPATASVEIVRGTTGTSYEVKRYGSR
jgi:pilus assembly protein CpaB